MAAEELTDYYELLQISPNAEADAIQRVYRMLAARYHPDNPNTGNPEIFAKLREAFEVLSHVERRAAYDEQLRERRAKPLPVFEQKEFMVGTDAESTRRLGVLCLLYNRRRSQPDEPSMSMLELEGLTALPREHLEFTVWYLKEKGHVERGEASGEFSITSGGADWVESKITSNSVVHRLLLNRAMNQE